MKTKHTFFCRCNTCKQKRRNSLLYLGLLICLIVSLVIKGFYSGIFIPGFFFLVAYLSYLAINFSSKESILFRYYKKDGSMFSVMESLFKTAPLIRMKSSSFHYFNQEKKAQIFSYKDIQTFPYLSYRDVSGLFLLDLKDATTNDKSYIVLHLKKEINFADTLTYKYVETYGLRNSQLLTIAPTGTLSTMLGISGGIEPIFANSYTRKTESLHGHDEYYKVYTPIVQEYMDAHGLKDESELPKWFVTSSDISPRDRIAMQAVWQDSIDASISSTINLPETATVEDIKDIYMTAWEMGLKGVTVFRNGCKRTGILTTDSKEVTTCTDESEAPKYNYITPVSRKSIGTTHGNTYCKKCACGTLYITLNRDDDGNVVESFIHTSKGGICQANTSAVNRLVSLCMRSGVKTDEIIDQLKGITCGACTKAMSNGIKLDGISCPDILARTLIEFCKPTDEKKLVEKPTNQECCPECGEPIIHDGGCVQCTNCGWSKCS